MSHTNVVELQSRRVHRCACKLMQLELRLHDAPTRAVRAQLTWGRATLLDALEREAQLRPARDELRDAIIDVLDAYDRLLADADPESDEALAAYELAVSDLAHMPTSWSALAHHDFSSPQP